MPPRPNPFLERRLRSSVATSKQDRLFPVLRDWTGFFVSIIALVTSATALWNTLKGPEPKIAPLNGDTITIFKSSEAIVGDAPLILKNEFDQNDSFPLILVQPLLYNRAVSSTSVAVRKFKGALQIMRHNDKIFEGEFFWFRITQSDSAVGADGLVTLKVKAIDQPKPIILSGGNSWSQEILLIPERTYANKDWSAFGNALKSCDAEQPDCNGGVRVEAWFDDGSSISTECHFAVDQHSLSYLQGRTNKYFTTPYCE